MTRSLSVRLDADVVDALERAAKARGVTRRVFLEDAIRRTVEQPVESGDDVWSRTLGAWKRRESPATTLRRARTAFRRSFGRLRAR